MMSPDYRHYQWAALIALVAADLRRVSPSPEHDDALWHELRRRVASHAAHVFRTSPTLQSDLDDVVQEVLIRLQTPSVIEPLAAKPHPGGYVVAMIKNAMYDVARRKRRERSYVERLEREPYDQSIDGYEELLSNSDLVEKTLATLSASDRALLRRRFWNNEPIAEIARREGVNYSAIATRLFRLLRKLRHVLSGDSRTN